MPVYTNVDFMSCLSQLSSPILCKFIYAVDCQRATSAGRTESSRIAVVAAEAPVMVNAVVGALVLASLPHPLLLLKRSNQPPPSNALTDIRFSSTSTTKLPTKVELADMEDVV